MDAPDLNLIVVHRLIAQRRADAKRRKAAREREAAALVIKRAAEEAAEQAAAHAAEFADLEQLRVLDPLVAEFRRKGLSVPDETLVALGRDTDWERTAPVQRALAAMLVDQNARLERMEHDADGTPPVVVIDGRLMPAAHLAPDLARSVERWSSDPAFRAVAAVLWPAPPPVAASPEVALGAVPAPASTQPEDAIERNRRWAAAYRERLMVASDADQRWDVDAGFGRSRDERVEAEPPTRTKVTSATLAARLRADHGLGG